jgi:hypothetical protein
MLMRQRHRLTQLLANMEHYHERHHPEAQRLVTPLVGSCQIRTAFLETQDRALVVAYVHRVYPGAKVLERD